MPGALTQAADDYGPEPTGMPMPQPGSPQGGALSSAMSNDDLNAVSERAMAVQRASRRLAALKYSNIDYPMLGAAAGLLSPTKSGRFPESLGKAAEGMMGGIKGDLENQQSAEQTEGGFLQNQMMGMNLQGYRDFMNAAKGQGPAGGQGGQGGQTPSSSANYPVQPVYDIVQMARQARILSTIPNPNATKMAQSYFSLVEKALTDGKYIGVDGNTYNIPGSILASAKAEYGKAIGETLAKNQGSVRAPAVLGPTRMGGIGPEVLSDGVAQPGATGTGSPSPTAPAPLPTPPRAPVTATPLAPITPSPASPAMTPPVRQQPAPLAGGMGTGAGNIPPGQPGPGPGPHGQIQPTVTPLGGGRSVVNLPPSEAQTTAYQGGLPGEAETIGKDMGKWYNDIRAGYQASVGMDQNLDNGFKALQQFRPGATTPEQAQVARFVKAFGGDPAKLKLASPEGTQELGKAMTNMIFSAIRQVSSRPAYLEFQMLGNAYPNEAMEPEAALKILTTLKAKMQWERGMFENVEAWRKDPANRGKSLQDFDLVNYLKSNPMPKYEDDALIDYVNRGGVKGVKNWNQLLNNPARAGEAPNAGQTLTGRPNTAQQTVVPGQTKAYGPGGVQIFAGVDGKWHSGSFTGPEWKP